MSNSTTNPRNFAFVFPMASGHINPSLPVARVLVSAGHKVHYLCSEQMREAVEDTGATFHSDADNQPEMYSGRERSLVPAMMLREEYGLEDNQIMFIWAKLGALTTELLLKGVLRWLRSVQADAILYCPLMNGEAAYAGKILGIPSVALLTTAGPGSVAPMINELMSSAGVTDDELFAVLDTYEPHKDAVTRMNEQYSLGLSFRGSFDPKGFMPMLQHSSVTLVTTCDDLQDPIPPQVQRAYSETGTRFEAVGALLDKEGSRRAAGHKTHSDCADIDTTGLCQSVQKTLVDGADALRAVRAARSAGRTVVLASMGTVITGDGEEIGWSSRPLGADGVRRGLTGKELCHAAWAGLFDAFGHDGEEGPLVVLALGPQPDALEGLEPPANVICSPVLPQVDILKVGIDLFLTHGGQNSFTEALSCGVPVMVCPGFGDQVVNAHKAEKLGVGLFVARPDAEPGMEKSVAMQYQTDVSQALTAIFAQASFRDEARGCQERLQRAGGVTRAVAVMLEAADSHARGSKQVTAEAEHSVVRPQFAGA